MKPEQERVRSLLTDTVTLLCRNGLQFNKELKVQGLLGITTDDEEVFVVHINEKFAGLLSVELTGLRKDEGSAVSSSQDVTGGTGLLGEAHGRNSANTKPGDHRRLHHKSGSAHKRSLHSPPKGPSTKSPKFLSTPIEIKKEPLEEEVMIIDTKGVIERPEEGDPSVFGDSFHGLMGVGGDRSRVPPVGGPSHIHMGLPPPPHITGMVRNMPQATATMGSQDVNLVTPVGGAPMSGGAANIDVGGDLPSFLQGGDDMNQSMAPSMDPSSMPGCSTWGDMSQNAADVTLGDTSAASQDPGSQTWSRTVTVPLPWMSLSEPKPVMSQLPLIPVDMTQPGGGGGAGATSDLSGVPSLDHLPGGGSTPHWSVMHSVGGSGGGLKRPYFATTSWYCGYPGCSRKYSNHSNLLQHQRKIHGRGYRQPGLYRGKARPPCMEDEEEDEQQQQDQEQQDEHDLGPADAEQQQQDQEIQE